MRHLALPALVLLSTAVASPLQVALGAHDPALPCGATTTPALTVTGTPPAGTKSLALIVWDQQPHALSGRWLVYDLPPTTRTLTSVPAATLAVAGGYAATNEAGRPGYSPVCLRGAHDIYVDLYAIDVHSLNIAAGSSLQRVHALIKRHRLFEAKAHLPWVVR
ncbi:phosphatidylethanolamine-binding protein (PEBP) family uncharacterized protein [Deinococcus metalli]|uniref:Phosphatidylethanolamine-binding protein (PEBP) family uncharacterized protein n=1 Tax=Deinococcus metalli TaxID=1141878 RepID=A0A7W8KHK6_9DEIO|nr:hypothetical protein [Deinococcus metalli]MBB5376664.1 phosphatidylethanolamine-binding protein (PEBP) family uncharacterized protein [Deinococcus metalli]GHF42405.1 hypothetical protein GCM10017781_18370 [Deinococcus metalli]